MGTNVKKTYLPYDPQSTDDLKKIVAEKFEQTGELHYQSGDSKSEIEFQRYKQDCRKRALDMGASYGTVVNSTPSDIMEAADKYYNWLISIPNQ